MNSNTQNCHCLISFDQFVELQQEQDKPVVLTRDETNIDPRESYSTRERSRVWTPIDHYNPEFMNKMLTREQTQLAEHNFLKENKVLLRQKSIYHFFSFKGNFLIS